VTGLHSTSKTVLERKGSKMAKPNLNRVLADEVYPQEQKGYLHLIHSNAAEALVASLILRHGSLELNRLTHACLLNGMTCPLTKYEYELLVFLLLHRGQIWSKDELTKRVWQREPSSVNLVAVYVNSLRRKLGPGILRTVCGQGYTIDVENCDQLSAVSIS
jgi:DNA-binding response OmpR family regulator